MYFIVFYSRARLVSKHTYTHKQTLAYYMCHTYALRLEFTYVARVPERSRAQPPHMPLRTSSSQRGRGIVKCPHVSPVAASWRGWYADASCRLCETDGLPRSHLATTMAQCLRIDTQSQSVLFFPCAMRKHDNRTAQHAMTLGAGSCAAGDNSNPKNIKSCALTRLSEDRARQRARGGKLRCGVCACDRAQRRASWWCDPICHRVMRDGRAESVRQPMCACRSWSWSADKQPRWQVECATCWRARAGRNVARFWRIYGSVVKLLRAHQCLHTRQHTHAHSGWCTSGKKNAVAAAHWHKTNKYKKCNSQKNDSRIRTDNRVWWRFAMTFLCVVVVHSVSPGRQIETIFATVGAVSIKINEISIDTSVSVACSLFTNAVAYNRSINTNCCHTLLQYCAAFVRSYAMTLHTTPRVMAACYARCRPVRCARIFGRTSCAHAHSAYTICSRARARVRSEKSLIFIWAATGQARLQTAGHGVAHRLQSFGQCKLFNL